MNIKIQEWLDEHEAPNKIGGTVLYVRSEDVLELFQQMQAQEAKQNGKVQESTSC